MTVDSPSDSPRTEGAAPASKPTYDEIALRAYFLALDRHRRGEPSDPQKDWTEAEQQLRPTGEVPLPRVQGRI
ncbi:MAG: DUF2934 domain-containing protein [Chthoniobacter sp.]